MDLEGRDAFFNNLKKLAENTFGKKKRYVILIAYEGKHNATGVQTHTQRIHNLSPTDPLIVWKLILVSLLSQMQYFNRQYQLDTGIQQQKDGVEEHPPGAEGRK